MKGETVWGGATGLVSKLGLLDLLVLCREGPRAEDTTGIDDRNLEKRLRNFIPLFLILQG